MIEVADPDPAWPATYARVEAEVRAALGPALRAVEHVGSTAVPGLPAKPVIDVMAAVDALGEAEARLLALEAAGLALAPTDMAARLFLQRPAGPDGPAVNLHVVTWASWPHRKERRLRDRLRARPEEARAYGALKRDLARRHGDVEAYTRAKTALIQEIMDRDADEAGRPREDAWE